MSEGPANRGPVPMASAALQSAGRTGAGSAVAIETGLAGLVLAALVLRFFLVFRLNVNWDEFYFLSLVHDYLRGTLTLPFQTFHVHLFAWLPKVAGDEMTQILVARLIMATLGLASAGLLYGIGRRFLTRAGALFGLLAYLSFGYVLEHGASFRVDPILTVLALAALYAILRRPGGAAGAMLAGAASAVALLISVKMALLLAVIGAVYLCLLVAAEDRRRALVAPAVFLLTLAVCSGALFALHRATLATAEADAATFLAGAAAKTLTGQDLIKPLRYFAASVLQNPGIWLLLLGGFAIALREAVRYRTRMIGEKLIPVAFCLMLPTLLLYRNAFPYYYVYVLAPAALLAGLAFDRLAARFHRDSDRLAPMPALLLLLLTVTLLFNAERALPDRQAAQRQFLDVVHARFPQPVPYLDGFGMVGSFPRVGFFMSSWGMQDYYAAGRPLFSGAADDAPPLLVIANSPALGAALLPEGSTAPPEVPLLDADIRYLRANYRPYWGLIFLPGKQVDAPPEGGSASFEIAIGGRYRLTAAVAVTLDGRPVAPGMVVRLERGTHRLTAPLPAGGATFDWAGTAPAPLEQPINIYVFTGFLYRD